MRPKTEPKPLFRLIRKAWRAAASADQVDEDQVLERILEFRADAEANHPERVIEHWGKKARQVLRAAGLSDQPERLAATIEETEARGLAIERRAAKLLLDAAAWRAAIAAGDGLAITRYTMALQRHFDRWDATERWERPVNSHRLLCEGGKNKGPREDQERNALVARRVRELSGQMPKTAIAEKIRREIKQDLGLDMKASAVRSIIYRKKLLQ
jgi:hypothetical protein